MVKSLSLVPGSHDKVKNRVQDSQDSKTIQTNQDPITPGSNDETKIQGPRSHERANFESYDLIIRTNF